MPGSDPPHGRDTGRVALSIDPSLRAALERLGHEFQAEFLGRALPARRRDAGLLSDLAHAYTRLGRYDDGLVLDRRVVELEPDDPVARYNLACSLSLTGRLRESLEELANALDLGWSDYELARSDPDLFAVRELPGFRALFGDEPVDD